MIKTMSIVGVLAILLTSLTYIPSKDNPSFNQSTPTNLRSARYTLQNERRASIGHLQEKHPLVFTENAGQFHPDARFVAAGSDKTIRLGLKGITISVSQERGRHTSSDIQFLFMNAGKDIYPRGEDKSRTIVSYFRGGQDHWKTNIPSYKKIIYSNLWKRIDLVCTGDVNQFKYEWIVEPGARVEDIQVAITGADKTSINKNGDLVIYAHQTSFIDKKPFAYQLDKQGYRKNITANFCKIDDSNGNENCYGISVGAYDFETILYIDPAILVYCGYLGGAGSEWIRGTAVDNEGNCYVTGMTKSNESSFPVEIGPDLSYGGGDYDAFIAKIDASGTDLIYCGYISGAGNEEGFSIGVDLQGNAYIAGFTTSDETSFPVVGGPDLTYNGETDAFVAKINKWGNGLDYCGYIGGANEDRAHGIAVDNSGNAYITGWTISSQITFPVSVGPDLLYGGSRDGFVAKIDSDGSHLDYCGYIGGAEEDTGIDIALDSEGSTYIGGSTQSYESSFPVLVGPDLTYNGGLGDYAHDGFVAKINPFGTSFVYCGYIGGAYEDTVSDIAVDGHGNGYVTGQTKSREDTFPVITGPDLTYNGGVWEGFIAKINNQGTGLLYCGYIGGSADDWGVSLAVDSNEEAYVTGITQSSELSFPVRSGPDLTYNGSSDGYVLKINSNGTEILYCGYIGGDRIDHGADISVDSRGNAYVAGETLSSPSTFPLVTGPDLTFNGGDEDAFAAKISFPFLHLVKPNGGELWKAGTNHNVTWLQSSLSSPLIIELYKGGVLINQIGSVSASSETYLWNIPASLPPGNDYQIKISRDPIEDSSNGFFTIQPAEIEAQITIHPQTINLKSSGQYVTIYIELPLDHEVQDIIVSTVAITEIDGIKLGDPIEAKSKPTEVGDFDQDGIQDLMVKVRREELISRLSPGFHTIQVKGNLTTGVLFIGSDRIRAIH